MFQYLQIIGRGIRLAIATDTREQAEDKAWDYAYSLRLKNYTITVSDVGSAIVVRGYYGVYSACRTFRYVPS